MQAAYDTWSRSAHKDIECHTCHRASIADQNRYLLTMLIKRPKEIPARHRVHMTEAGLTCGDCHRPHAWKITEAQAKVDCARCHDYRPPESFVAEIPGAAALTAHAMALGSR